ADEDAAAVRRDDGDDLALDALRAERGVEEVAPRDALAGPADEHAPQLGGRPVVPLAVVAEDVAVAHAADLAVLELAPDARDDRVLVLDATRVGGGDVERRVHERRGWRRAQDVERVAGAAHGDPLAAVLGGPVDGEAFDEVDGIGQGPGRAHGGAEPSAPGAAGAIEAPVSAGAVHDDVAAPVIGDGRLDHGLDP